MKRFGAVPVLVLALLGASFSRPSRAMDLLPNMKALPAHDLYLYVAGDGTTRKLLFSTSSWNAGLGPLEVWGGEVTSAGQAVYQRIYRSDGSHYDVYAGTFVWHPEHHHFHFDDYALYTLQPVSGGSAATSSKTSFCLLDTDPWDLSLPGAPSSAVYTNCDDVVQGMSIGWSDEYVYLLAGQSFDFTNYPSGDYRLIVAVDPDNRLVETDESDNISCLLFNVDVSTRKITVLGACDGTSGGGGTTGGGGGGTGGDTQVVVSSISPSTTYPGTSIGVTITGSGFAAGMSVSFVNGSGPQPYASTVVVQSATTITATVTVGSKKGKQRPHAWDLRVGSGILTNAFTVLAP